ncbi:hypothetical protein ON010_g7761 [Phytophthora cinnamomi]|nr:hypothetical protein ON010_g7761 [Phytophthora cinnamomi]
MCSWTRATSDPDLGGRRSLDLRWSRQQDPRRDADPGTVPCPADTSGLDLPVFRVGERSASSRRHRRLLGALRATCELCCPSDLGRFSRTQMARSRSSPKLAAGLDSRYGNTRIMRRQIVKPIGNPPLLPDLTGIGESLSLAGRVPQGAQQPQIARREPLERVSASLDSGHAGGVV